MVILRIVLLILTLALLGGCGSSGTRHIIERLPEPGNRYDLVFAVTSDEGATGEGPIGLYLVPKGGNPLSDRLILSGYKLGSADGKRSVGLRWIARDHLLISIGTGYIVHFTNNAYVRVGDQQVPVAIKLEDDYFSNP